LPLRVAFLVEAMADLPVDVDAFLLVSACARAHTSSSAHAALNSIAEIDPPTFKSGSREILT